MTSIEEKNFIHAQVLQRMQETGENYSVALVHVKEQNKKEIEEMESATSDLIPREGSE